MSDRSNRWSGGLQKLKFYCEVCQKQCSDRNGFQNHVATPKHLRMIELVSERPIEAILEYSKRFEEEFLSVLRSRFPKRRVKANMVYGEYIKDKAHTHMNATKWTTLASFCKHLFRSGVVSLDFEGDRPFIELKEDQDTYVAQTEEAPSVASTSKDLFKPEFVEEKKKVPEELPVGGPAIRFTVPRSKKREKRKEDEDLELLFKDN